MFARARKYFVKTIGSLSHRFMLDRAGNFAMAFAIISVPLLTGMGAGIDYVRAMNLQRKIQSDLDAALVAAVKDLGTKNDEALKTELSNWMAADASISGAYVLSTSNVTIDSTNQTVTAKVTGSVDATFLRIIGVKKIPVVVQASVVGGETVSKTAFSMYLVLDRSGSMKDPTNSTYTTTCGKKTCTAYYTKMESLKMAVSSLFGQFTAADPTNKYVRTAAVSYNDAMQTPSAMAWGSSAAMTYVNNLTPSSLTNSSVAMATAYNVLKATEGTGSENYIHNAKNGAVPVKYIVLMTDGENTKTVNNKTVDNPEADTATKATCDDAKKAGIKIYSIAFMAPERGQALLRYCATPDVSENEKYYFAAENTAQIVAAFDKIGEQSAKNLVRLTN